MSPSNSRPNILFIMADQFRHDYLGCAGADFVRTPNLDRIAANGVRFSQCATNSPVCAPARVALASGLEPHRLGAIDNAVYLPRSIRTYYERLRDDDYWVGCVGKLDLAKPAPYNGRRGDRPCAFTYGFTHPEECEGKMHAGNSPTPLGPYGFHLQERGLYDDFHKDFRARGKNGWIKNASHDSVLPTDAFEDIYIGRRAAEWIDNVSDEFPWHYFVSFVGPHDPFDPPTEYADRYRDAEMPPAIEDTMEGKPEKHRKRQRGLDAEEIAVTRRQYCAAIEAIDDMVGEIVAALERRGLADNTYIVFSSDHGEMLGDHGLYTKSVPYEASMRVPLIVAGPGIEGDRVSEALVELIDVNATICEFAGLPPQEDIDARSVGPVLRGESAEHRDETLTTHKGFSVARTREHKLILNDGDNSATELYDLREDPDELSNVAAERPDIVRELHSRLRNRSMEGGWRR